MSFEVIKEESVELKHDNCIIVHTITKTLENGKQISKGVNRTCYPPITRLEELPEKARPIAELIWTQDVIDAYIEETNKPLGE